MFARVEGELLTGPVSGLSHLHHVGWVVRSIDASLPGFQRALGLADLGIEDHGWIRVAFLGVGCSMIELLEPKDTRCSEGLYLATHGEGIHHIAYAVGDVAATLEKARAAGVKAIDEAPRPGARRSTIAFVDPERPDGVLIEYVQDALGASRIGHPVP